MKEDSKKERKIHLREYDNNSILWCYTASRKTFDKEHS